MLATPPRNTPTWAGAAVLIGLVIVVYIPAMSGDFIWDDHAHVVTREHMQTLKGLLHTWFVPGATQQYYPLIHSVFWVEFHLWGMNPAGYHVVNILLHGLNAVLLWRVLHLLPLIRGSEPPGGTATWPNEAASFLAALVFALHPVHVESVAWISERKNVLSGAFYLAAMWLYLRFEPTDPATTPHPRRWRLYGWSVALFVCALLSKTVTASLPAAILLLLWWRRGGLAWRDLLPVALACLGGLVLYGLLREYLVLMSGQQVEGKLLAAMVVVLAAGGGLWGLIRLWRDRIQWRIIGPLMPMFVLAMGVGLITPWMEKYFIGAGGERFDLSWIERLLIAGRACWFYAGKVFWPANLVFIYPRWEVDDRVWWQYLYPLAAAGLLAFAWAGRRRWGLGPLIALLYFGGTLFPALGFFDVYPFVFSFVADHFQYLASIGMIALGAAAVVMVAQRLTVPSVWPTRTVAAVLALTLGVLTWRQCFVYADSPTLFHHTIARNPTAWMAYNNLATHYNRLKQHDKALDLATRSIEILPANDFAHNNRAIALVGLNRTTEAIEACERSLDLKTWNQSVNRLYIELLETTGQLDRALARFEPLVRANPADAAAQYALAYTLDKLGRLDQAVHHYRTSIEHQPYNPEAHNDLAFALLRLGRVQDAMPYLRNALRLRPSYPDAIKNLGVAHLAQGRIDDGLAELHRALSLDPDLPDAHYELGLVHLNRKQPLQAAEHFEHALRVTPHFIEARVNLATALYNLGQAGEAIEQLRRVVSERPGHATAHRNLAVLLEQGGNAAEAVNHYRAAVAVRSDWPEALDRLAWILATHPDAAVRHGADAVTFARRACELTAYNVPRLLDTLAAAYAELGDQANAVASAQRALQLARAAGEAPLARDIAIRLELYQRGQAYRDQP